MSETREVKVGIRIDTSPARKGITFFGTDEVNALVAKGWRLLSVLPGGALVDKTVEGPHTLRMELAGCDLKVTLAAPGIPPR